MAEQDLRHSSVNSKSSVGRAAAAMSVATLMSRVLGLVREQVFAYFFGAGHATDAFQIAFRIPNLLRDLFAEGAMSASLVPTFTRVRAEEGDRRAWRVAGLVFRVLFVFVSFLAVVGVIFAPQLVEIYASAYHLVEGKFELTVTMTRLLFPFFPLVALAAAFMGILNACGKFFLPAFASALFNAASIVVGVALTLLLPQWGVEPIVGMAIGVLAGGAVQAFCQLPTLYRVGYRWPGFVAGKDPLWHRDPALRKVLVMMLPGTLGLAATQVNVLVNSILATSQGAGAVSWLNYAFRLMQFPIGVFGVSLASATLPQVSRMWVAKDVAGTAQVIQTSLRQVFAVNLPASAGLAFLGVPIIQMLFQHGRFDASDTQATAWALAMYAVGLTAYSGVKVLVPVCYALGKVRIAVISSVFSVLFTLLCNWLLIGPMGFAGLALGTSCAAVLNFVFLLFAVRLALAAQGQSFDWGPIFKPFVVYLGVALGMGAVCGGSHHLWDQFLGSPEGAMGRIFKVLVLVGEGGLFVIGAAYLLRLQDLLDAFDIFTKKVKNKLSRKSN